MHQQENHGDEYHGPDHYTASQPFLSNPLLVARYVERQYYIGQPENVEVLEILVIRISIKFAGTSTIYIEACEQTKCQEKSDPGCSLYPVNTLDVLKFLKLVFKCFGQGSAEAKKPDQP